MDKFTVQNLVFLYESTRKGHRKYGRKFLPGVQVPNRNTMHNLINEVSTDGVLKDRKPECQQY
jgi:hypothetical protein